MLQENCDKSPTYIFWQIVESAQVRSHLHIAEHPPEACPPKWSRPAREEAKLAVNSSLPKAWNSLPRVLQFT